MEIAAADSDTKKMLLEAIQMVRTPDLQTRRTTSKGEMFGNQSVLSV